MTKRFLFLARATPASPSPDTSEDWVLVFESPTAEETLQDDPLLNNSVPIASPALSPTPSLATPNSLLQARAWPLLGPRVTRPSKGPSRRGKSSLGTSSFSRGRKTS